MDLIGPLPTGPGQVNYVIVAVDYFTKWIEAKPAKNPTANDTWKFFHDQVLCRFRLPYAVVLDRGPQFSSQFSKWCDNLHIKHWKASTAHPEGNGQAEAANKLVLSAFQKDLEGARGKWPLLLPKALLAIWTAIRGPTGETPFALTYGSEALAPVEMGLPTLRVATYNHT